jgi:hypothetical protein
VAIAAVSIEGVLARPERDTVNFASMAPVQAGLRLLVALKQMYKVILLTDEEDTTYVEHFLKQYNVEGHAYLLHRERWQVNMSHLELRMAQFDHVRGQLSIPLSMVIDADPSVAASAMHKGMVALLFAHPTYQRPEFRPDDERGVRAWEDIDREITEQRELKGGDPRLMPGIGI